MGKLLLAAAMLVVFGGPALAGHEAPRGPLVEGNEIFARTPYCLSLDDARLVGEKWAAEGRAAATVTVQALTTETGGRLTRCGEGRGRVTPLELMGEYTSPNGLVLNLVRVMADGINLELFLLTTIPFLKAGKPA